MPTSVRGISERHSMPSRSAGFTLLELLIVLVIVGLSLGMASLSVMPSSAKTLETDAQRIALLLQLARDEAIVRNRPIMFETHGNAYRFLVRTERGWQTLQGDEQLRERDFRLTTTQLRIEPSNGRQIDANTLRIVFGREPVDQPFVLTLRADDAEAAIRADGIGHFVLQ